MVDNMLGVGVMGDKIVLMRGNLVFSRADAINMAAWIVALTDKEEFEKVFEEVVRS